MADSKISALPAVVTPAGTDEFAVNQSATSKKMTLTQIKSFAAGNVAPLTFSAPLEDYTNTFSTFTATGGTVGYASLSLQLALTTSNGSTSSVYQNYNVSSNADLFSYASYAFNAVIGNEVTGKGGSGTGTAYYVIFGANAFPVSSTSFTDRHVGFVFRDDGTTFAVEATNADGTTQTRTDITAQVDTTGANDFYGVIYDGTDLKFYVNDNLAATHTTNLPTGGGSVDDVVFMNYAKNFSAATAASEIRINHLSFNGYPV